MNAAMQVLLPHQPAPVTPHQAALTEALLLPARAELFALLLALRQDVDSGPGTRLPPLAGAPYPIGHCREITEAVAGLLRERLADARADGVAETALRAFVGRGGVIRQIWGALKDRYLQNALQFGGLYVDVANDSVTVTRPPVEIAPIAESGFEAFAGPDHFAHIVRRYWGASLFANHALPDLAPILPIISVSPGAGPQLESATDYMIALLCRDGFVQSEAWLAAAPPPPPEIVAALHDRWRRLTGSGPLPAGADAAIAACRAARAAGAHRDAAWRDARVIDYVRFRAIRP